MEELVETIAKYLVDDPEKVTVQDIGEDDKHEEIMQLSVASDDMGKVIGKQGRIAKAIRGVVKAASADLPKKVQVDIVQ